MQTPLQRYAHLLVTRGMNVQPDQLVSITGELGNEELVRLLVEGSYRAGAKYVSSEIIDPFIDRIQLLHAKEEHLSFIPKHFPARLDEVAESDGANIRLVGVNDPALFSDIPPAKLSRLAAARKRSRELFYRVGINGNRAQWCVAAAANPAWAKVLFPTLPAEEALTKLWEEIFRLARVDTSDYLERWDLCNRLLRERSEYLNSLGISALHFTGGGTDLTVGIHELASFGGGSKRSAIGAEFMANVPTEEVFTTPDWRRTEGVAVVTRPVLVNDVEVRGLTMTFKNGEISSFEAESGGDSFAEYIATDAGAKRLGEVALVGIDSPIYQSGLVYREILFDENACCHIAVGSAYKTRISDGSAMTAEQLAAVGCNESVVHTDFMISSAEVSVKALLRSGGEVELLRNGEWVIETHAQPIP